MVTDSGEEDVELGAEADNATYRRLENHHPDPDNFPSSDECAPPGGVAYTR